MRNRLFFAGSALALFALLGAGCGSKHSSDFGNSADGGSGAVGDGDSGGVLSGGDSGSGTSATDGPGEVFGHSDDTLYKLEPISKVVTTVGKFSCVSITCPDSGEG